MVEKILRKTCITDFTNVKFIFTPHTFVILSRCADVEKDL